MMQWSSSSVHSSTQRQDTSELRWQREASQSPWYCSSTECAYSSYWMRWWRGKLISLSQEEYLSIVWWEWAVLPHWCWPSWWSLRAWRCRRPWLLWGPTETSVPTQAFCSSSGPLTWAWRERGGDVSERKHRKAHAYTKRHWGQSTHADIRTHLYCHRGHAAREEPTLPLTELRKILWTDRKPVEPVNQVWPNLYIGDEWVEYLQTASSNAA